MAKKKAKKKVAKKKNGRPTKYKSRYCNMLIKDFSIEPFSEIKIGHKDELGKKWYEIKREANRLPTLQRFASKIKVGISTVYDWLDKNHASYQKKFSDAFARARVLRQNFLMENGLAGTHEGGYAKFVATNLTDMKDKKKHEVTGEAGGPIPVQVIDFAKIDTTKLNEE